VSRYLTGAVLALLVVACSPVPPVPEDRFYRLATVHPAGRLPAPVLRGGLSVDYVQADPLRSGRSVLYSDSRSPLQLRRYHYEFWVDQPPRLLRRALASYLREAGVADQVVAVDEHPGTAYSLRLRLLKFEQVLNKAGAGVSVAVEATLARSPDAIAWTRVYERSRASASARMDDTASAMQAALGEVFAQLEADLVSSRGGAR
jgi:ABC-type uncharacterized transport system auxiliary subunit